MPDVTSDVMFSVGNDNNAGTVILGVEAGSVMRVNIDDTLSVSGEAADAYATGQAIAGKANTADIQQNLNVNGRRAGAGSWAIPLNGNNIPAQNDSDTESVAEALERLEGVGTGLASDLGTEEQTRSAADGALQTAIDAETAARQAADTTLSGRVTTLEGRAALTVDLEDITYTGSWPTISDSRITAGHLLAGYQFYTGSTITDATATGDILADLSVTTSAGAVAVTIDALHQSGCSCRLILMYAEEAGS